MAIFASRKAPRPQNGIIASAYEGLNTVTSLLCSEQQGLETHALASTSVHLNENQVRDHCTIETSKEH